MWSIHHLQETAESDDKGVVKLYLVYEFMDEIEMMFIWIIWALYFFYVFASAVANAEKLARFRSFYLSVITYVYFTRIVCCLSDCVIFKYI